LPPTLASTSNAAASTSNASDRGRRTRTVDVGPRYRIERQLGEGGMGLVYEATDLELHRRVAIKLIRHERDDEDARARFLREARSAAALTHPHACQLYEVSEHQGQPFLVLELLDGEPLSKRVERGRLTIQEAATILVPLMEAVSAFHRAGLVHRDLKPSNVFLTTQGVKLLDFGLARRADRSNALTETLMTSPGAVTGTMRYMAPEQITGDPIDGRADVFALGVLLYEMLTGRIPFNAETNIDWLNAVLTDDPQSLGSPELVALDPIVMRALQRRPQDRYESVDHMLHAFQTAIGAGADGADRATSAQAITQASAVSSSAPHAPAPHAPAECAECRLAVLPFRVPQDDDDLRSLEEGLPEALTAALSDSPDWRVISNRLAQPYGRDADLVAVGQKLEVERLLTGSVMRAGDDIRITAQLVDASDGAVCWSLTSNHRWESAVALQDTVCREIRAGLDEHRAHPSS
jgi:serine/threonine-protein kinase